MRGEARVAYSAAGVDVRRVAALAALTKPRVVLLVALCTALGFVVGSGTSIAVTLLVHTAFGTALVAAGGAALNQYRERDVDARMRRTAGRPLPTGRLLPLDALAFGAMLGIAGTVYLFVLVNAATALLGMASFAVYAFVYTPLKRVTPRCIEIGAVAGALPLVMGWTGVRGTLDIGALTLFAILFTWQLPHFTAIAWMYRDEYANAGLKMTPPKVSSPAGTVRRIRNYNYVMVLASLSPVVFGVAGWFYAASAVVLGIVFTAIGWKVRGGGIHAYAKNVFYASLVYLPLLLAALAWWRVT